MAGALEKTGITFVNLIPEHSKLYWEKRIKDNSMVCSIDKWWSGRWSGSLFCLPCLFIFVLLFFHYSRHFLTFLCFLIADSISSWFICLFFTSPDTSILRRTSIPTAHSGAIPSAPWWDSGPHRTVVCWPPIVHTPAVPAHTSPALRCSWPTWKSRYGLMHLCLQGKGWARSQDEQFTMWLAASGKNSDQIFNKTRKEGRDGNHNMWKTD